MDSIVSDY